MLLAKGLRKFFIKGNPVFSNCSKRLRQNPPDCPILFNLNLDSFIFLSLMSYLQKLYETLKLVY